MSGPHTSRIRLEDIPMILLEMEEGEDRQPVAGPSGEGQEPESDSDFSDAEVNVSDHDTATEEEVSEGDLDDESEENSSFYLGKDKTTKWRKDAFRGSKTKKRNIVKIPCGPTRKVQNAVINMEIDAFATFFPVSMIDKIIHCTNLQIECMKVKYKRERDCKLTSREEIMALFGLLYLIGTKKGHHTNVEELWTSDGTGMDIVRSAMSYRRFLLLTRHLRFDDKSTRAQRKEVDKLAPIRDIFDEFVENCILNYNPSEYVTIDEMLHAFRGRCSFVQYIPSKPAKYGVKFFAMCDAKTFYTSNLEVYVGKQPEGPFNASNAPLDIVKRLVTPIEKSGINLTTDNWYTSVPLSEYLLMKNITLLGTVRKNKREIPPSFLPNKNKPVGTSVYGFQKDKVLVSYTPKKNKAVLLLSTMHEEGATDEQTGKPVMIVDYNKTKIGVDMVDKMISGYNVSRTTRRWPMVVFFACMNIGAINSQVIYSLLKPNDAPKKRRIFLHNLSLQLMNEHLIQRSSITTLPTELSAFLKRRFAPESPTAAGGPPTKKLRGRCFYCGRKKNKCSSASCVCCERFVCKKHSKIVCDECLGGLQNPESSGE